MPRNDTFQKLKIEDELTGGRLLVDLESFFEFSFWISEELEGLVSRLRPGHLAPPKVLGPKPPSCIQAAPGSCEN